MAEYHRMFAVTVRDKLLDIGVKPIFEPTGRNSRYYLKEDVLHLDLFKQTFEQYRNWPASAGFFVPSDGGRTKLTESSAHTKSIVVIEH